MNVVLFKTIGRGERQAVASFGVDEENISEQVSAEKMRHIAEAKASGAQLPVFELVTIDGHGKETKGVRKNGA